MADKVAGLLFRISADTKALQQGFKKTQTATKKMQTSMKALGGILAATFSISLVKNFTKEILNLYDIQAKAEASLLTALKGRTGVQDRLIQQAKELQKTTLYGDEETIAAMSLLAQMQLEEEAIRRLMPLIQDMATAKGMDLKAATDLVAKSVGSSTNALSRYGITIEGAVGSAARLESAVEALTIMFKGQAEVAAEAGTGGLKQLSNIWGDIKEDLGEVTVQAFNLNQNLSALNETLSNFSATNIVGEIRKIYSIAKRLNPVLALTALAVDIIKTGGKLAPIIERMKEDFGMDTGWTGGAGDVNKWRVKTGRKTPVATTATTPGAPAMAQPATAARMAGLGGISPISGFATQLNESATQLKNHFIPIMEEVQATMVNVGFVISSTFEAAANSFMGSIERLAGGGKLFERSFEEVLHSVGKFMQRMGTMIAAYGVAAKAMKWALLNPGAAIVAGLSLAAIGSAIAGLASRGITTGTGGVSGHSYSHTQTMASGGMDKVQFEGVVRGQDLYLIQKTYSKNLGRM